MASDEKKVRSAIGCDVSCNSPAFVYVQRNPFFIGVLAYSDRLLLPENSVDNPPHSSVRIRILRLPREKGIERYSRFYEDLFSFICDECPEYPAVAAVEDYAYGVQKTNSFSMLCEANAIVRLALQRLSIRTEMVAISSNKKEWTGKGNATKYEMYKVFKDSKYAPHILQHPVLDASDPESHPLQDIVDALALAHHELRLLPEEIPAPSVCTSQTTTAP